MFSLFRKFSKLRRKTEADPKPPAAGLRSESLEPRVLFSADLPWVATDVPETDQFDQSYEQSIAPVVSVTSSATQTEQADRQNLVVVDPSLLSQLQMSASSVAEHYESAGFGVAVLQSTESGISQLDALLSSNHPIGSVDVLTTAQAQGINLGGEPVGVNDVLNSSSLITDWAAQLQTGNTLNFQAVGLDQFVDADHMADLLNSLTGSNVQLNTFAGVLPGLVAQPEQQARHEVVFVDTGVEGYQALVDDIRAAADADRLLEVILLDENRDGVEQISEILNGYRDLDAIHIVAHGTDGSVQLGAGTLSNSTLGSYNASLRGWQAALTDNADLLIYGCDLASTELGEGLIRQVADLTGADVAASDDLTGTQQLGGDWELEFVDGEIEAEIAFSDALQDRWMHVLASSPETQVNQTTTSAQETNFYGGGSIAADSDGNFVVIWQDSSSGTYDVYGRLFNADGSPSSDEFLINSTQADDQRSASVAMDADGDFVVTWTSFDQDQINTQGVYAQRFDANGVPQGTEFQVNTAVNGDQWRSKVGIDDTGNFVIVFTDDFSTSGDIFLQRYSAAGAALGSNTLVNSTTTDSQSFADVAVDGDTGNIAVVWESWGQDGDGTGVYARLLDSSGTPISAETQVNQNTVGFQENAKVAFAPDGGFVVAWDSGTDMSVRTFDATGAAVSAEIVVNTSTTGLQGTGDVAVDSDGRFVVTWASDGGSGTYTIAAQLFTLDGAKAGPEVLISETSSGYRGDVSVDFVGGVAAFSWSGAGAGDVDGVHARTVQFANIVVEDDSVTTVYQTPVVIDVLANDNDAQGDALVLLDVTDGSNGTVINNGDGTATYTPDPGYLGADSFSYIAADASLGLQHYWNLAGNVTDTIGSADGTIIGASTVAGSFGSGLGFNGSSDYVQIPDLTYGSESSISFDFKLDDNSGSLFQYLYSHGSVNDTNSINVFVNEAGHGTDPNMLRTVVRDGNDSLDNTALQVDVASLIGDGLWHNYTVTTGVSGVQVYLDGVLVASDGTRGTGSVDPTGDLYLGARQDLDADRSYGGALDSLRIYGSALTANQIIDIQSNNNQGTVSITVEDRVEASQNVPGAQTVNEGAVLTFSSGNVPDNSVSVSDSSISTDGLLRVAMSVENGFLNLSGLTGITFVDGANGSSQLVFEGTESAINAALEGMTFTPHAGVNGSVTLTMSTELASDLVGGYEFTADASDQSAGTVQDGSLIGDASIVNDAERGQVLLLDGAGDYVAIDGEFEQPTDVTLAAWVNFSSAAATAGEVISISNSVALRVGDLVYGVTGFFYDGTAFQFVSAGSSVNLNDDAWHHVAFSFDDTNNTQNLYIDGVLVASAAHTASIDYPGWFPQTTIGTHANPSESSFDFTGMIDDARVYTRALSADEIGALAADSSLVADTVAITVEAVNEAPSFFAGDGIETNFNSSVADGAADLLLRGDGRLVLVGTANDGAGTQIALTQYLEDGSLDTSFGTIGRVTTAINTTESVGAAELQADGSIIVVGATNDGTGRSAFTRYLADGTLDTDFGTNGHVVLDISPTSSEYLRDVVVSPEGKITAVGYANVSGDEVMTVVRLNADGSLDDTLNGSGILTLDLVAGDDRANSIALQDDGKMVIGGQVGSYSAGDVAVLRLNTDGSFDSSFNGTGLFTMDVSTVASGGAYTNGDSATAIAIDDSGRIVIGGNTYLSNSESLAMRLTSTGALDTSFNGTGYHVISAGVPHEGIYDIALQADGRLVLVGSAYTSSGINDVSVIRLNDDGTLDSSFDGDGMVRQPIGTATDQASAVVVDRLGNIVVAGRTDDGQLGTHLMRFNANGQLDSRLSLVNTLDGNPTFVEGGAAVVLDGDVQIFDEELSTADDFNGATLTLVRNGGTAGDDQYFATGTLNSLLQGSNNLVVGATTIGSVTQNAGGTLVLTFNSNATNQLVNEAMQQIAYSNASHTPPDSVLIDWTFNDGNSASSQGSGGAQTATGSTTVDITPVEGSISLSVNNPDAFGLQAQSSQTTVYAEATYLSQSIALKDDGSYVLVWAGSNDGDSHGVYARRFDAFGSPLGPETLVNTTTSNSQYYPSVSMDDAGNYVVVWHGEGTGDTGGIFGQRFDASGVAQGSEFLINSTTAGTQSYSSVGMDADGDFVVVWSGSGAGDSSGVFAQRFDANGTALGSEFLVNVTTTDAQNNAEVSVDSAGNFVVTWSSSAQDGSGYGAYVRSFSADGTAVTGEIQVDSDTTGAQWLSQVDVNDAGDFVVVWRDDGAANGIQAQLFNADGSKNGSEITVSDLLDSGDNYPAVQIDNAGNFVVVWQGFHDGDDNGILARQFDSSGTALGASFAVNSTTAGGQEYPAISMNDSGQFVIAFTDWTTGTVESRVYGLATTESGGTASVDVVLDVAPTADVTIAVSMPDGTEGSLSTSLLTFTTSNWNIAQTVTVTGIDDALNDGDVSHLLVFDPASSTDLNYNGYDLADLVISNLDNNPLVDLDADDSAAGGSDFSASYAEGNGPRMIVDSDAILSDPDSSTLDSLTVTITNALDGADEILAADTAGTSISASYINGVLTLSGSDTVANYQQVLRTVTYQNTALEPDHTSRAITFVASDGSNTNEVATTTLSIQNAADLSITAPATITTSEDTGFIYSGANVISVDDGIVADNPVRVSLSVANGTLALASQSGITIIEGANGTGNMVIDGLESDINSALNGLLYTPNSDYSGADTLAITTATSAGLNGSYGFEADGSDQSAGTRYHGTLNGDALIGSDIDRGQVLSLDGAGDFVQIDGLMDEPSDITLSAWINADSVDSLGAVVISLGTSPALYLNSDGTLIGFYESGGTNNIVQSTESLVGTGWRHVAVSIDAASSMSIYIDGVAVNSSIPVGTIDYDNSPDTFIGRAGDGATGFDFDGMIDDARVYSRALSADEIAVLATDQTETTASVAIAVDAVNDAPTFELQGESVFTLGGWGYGQNEDTLVLSDGSMLITPYDASSGDSVLVKLNLDGTIDTSFGTSGYADNASIGYIQSIVEQPDGKILVSGQNAGNIFLARYHGDGSLDTDFGVNGVATLTTGTFDEGADIALQSDGSIVLVGEYGDDSIITRFTSTGTQDNSFGSGGNVLVNIGGTMENLESVAILSDDSIVAVGETSVVRLDSNGTLDPGFGTGGILVLGDQISDVLVQADGKFVITGGNGTALYTTRFNTDGSIDTEYGASGTATWSALGASGYALVQQADGKLVVSGHTDTYPTQILTVRFNLDGSLDTTFGDGGAWVQTSSTDYSESHSVGLYNDGISERIVIGGYTTRDGFENSTWSTMIRLNHDGSLDSSLSTNTLDGEATFIEGGSAVVLDDHVEIFDSELSAADNFNGATLTLARSSGPNADDVFTNSGTLGLLMQGGNLVVDGTTIGTVVTNSAGTLTVAFNASATQSRVNEAVSQVAYSNNSDAPPNSIQIDWTFDDGNSGAQGSGGAGQALGSTTVDITPVNDEPTTADVSVSGVEDNVITITLTGSDVDGTVDSFEISSLPANGTLYVDAGLTDAAVAFNTYAASSEQLVVYFVPDSDWHGATSFTFAATDDQGLWDGTPATATITVTPGNDAPTLDLDADDSAAAGVDYAATWTEGSGPIPVVDSDAILSDIDSANLSSLTVTITNQVDGAAELLAADTTGTLISASYDSATGVLTLSGADTVASYQQVLRTITYNNTHATPYSEARVLDFVAIDGADSSQVASTTVSMSVTQGVLIVTNLSDDVNGDVTSIDDLIATQGGDGISLREAIMAANNSPNGSGPDVIRFDVAGSGPHTINLTSQLPTITQTILIDGSSEPDFAGTPMVVLDGSAAGAGAKAFYLGSGSDGSTIRGLVMHSFSTGIEIAGSDNNLIAGNYFGLGADGATNEGNTNNGIRLVGGSSNNTIGGLSAADRNVIAGSGGDGISISDVGTTGNYILGNYIGTSADGASAVANAVGIRIQNSATGNFVGGTAAGAGNIVSGNTGAGIAIDATSDNQTIQGNWIGLDQTGLAALGNGLAGIDATSNNNQIGGAGTGAGNVISGNTGAGIDLDGDLNFVEGNIIGLDAAAAGLLGNGGAGVFLSNGAATNSIGGTTAGAGNVISGNVDGIYIQDSTGTTIQGNLIGTDGTGLLDRGNLDRGIQIESGGDNTIIGGTTASARNVISANGTDGIILSDGSSPGTGTTGVLIQGNFIGVGSDGTTALGNGTNGIRITTVSGHLLGGSAAGAGNLIAHSGQDGIVIGAATATDNTILGNIIHSNTERAIDLSNDGTTLNDASANLDADAGANDLQNFAVLYSADVFGSDLHISGDLDSEANSSYRIEFFNNPLGQEDASGYGEARELLGFIVVTTDATGNAAIDTTLSGVSLSAGDRVTSTTTQIVDAGQVGVNDILAFGSTSEFSMNLPAAIGDPAPTIDLDADNSSGGASSNYIASFTEGDGPTLIADSDAILADPESANLTSLTVTISNLLDGAAEVLAADVAGTSISSSYDSGTGVLTLSGNDSVANYQQVLRTITYDNTSQAPDTTLRTVSFVASDGTNASNLAITAISMNAVNDAPINSVPGTQTVSEETSTAIAGISITDVDAESLNVTTQLQVGSGVLNVALSGSATVSAGTNGTGNLTILGTVTDVNATLATLTYTGDSNVIGVAADTLTVTTNDGGNSGSGGALQDIDTVQIDITNVNDAPTGNVLIDNTSPSQGDTLTASNSIVDADGISGPISYQWYRDGVAVSGATGPTYVTDQVDVGAVITVVASYTDDQGAAENVTSAGTAAVANVNDPVTGQPTIVGTTTEDQTLSADTSAIGDEDGLGTFSYQWYRDGVAIAGATAGVYTLDDADVDHVLTVNVSFVDGYGAAESTTSNATATIANVNDAPAGSVGIDNLNPAQGDTLTVSNTLSDADGLNGPISYQWYRDGVAISGATGATYTTSQVDVGTVITTVASYTDDQGTAESVTSAATAAVTNVNDAVTGQPVILGIPTEDQTLTVDTSGISDADGLGTFSYQWYRDGVAISGATADSHVLGDADVDTNITIAVSYTDGQGTAESATSAAVGPITNINDAPAGSVNIDNLSPAQGDVLTASNTLTDADGLSGAITYQWYRDGVVIVGATSTSYATVQADVGAAITATASYTDDQGNAESMTSGATALVTNVNDPVTGQPVIIGTTTEDQTLTIDTSAISDEDGLGSFNYQWYRDGVAVSGATANSYVLDDADVDSNISVIVAFTDGYGAAESTTSDSVGLIANVNDAPAGSVDIDNLSPTQGDTLTVSNTLFDADGLSGAVSYQWYRDGGAISGATGSTYTTVQADVGSVITAIGSYTDDQGAAESVTSAATAAVTNVNDAVSGQPVILGTPTEDQTLTIDTSGISDVDGLGAFGYQWYRDGVAISGATADSLVLDDADVGSNITIAVAYTDGQGTAESTTSTAVGPVANVNDTPAGSVDIDNLSPSQGDTLTVSNTLSDADGLSGAISYQWYRDGVAIAGATGTTYTTAQVDVGTVITTVASYTDDQGAAESVTSAATAAVANVNDAVSGQPGILGTTTEDETLSIDTSGISDEDGLGAFSFQWYRDGIAVGGATAGTYVLDDADVDSVLTVRVSYIDGYGSAESTTSNATSTIANVNDAPVGSVAIDNLSPAQGDTLTASNTLSDADGLSGPISYQWYRDGVAIAGATNDSFTTSQADVGAVMTVLASYTDDQGILESATSPATAAVANVNDAPVVTSGLVFSVQENSAVGALVGQVTASDVDIAATLGDWSIASGNSSGAFNIDTLTGEIRIADGSALDFETNSVFTLGITVSDGSATSAIVDVRIDVTNLDETPILGNDQLVTNEDSALIINSAALLANDSDPEAGPLILMSISQPANGIVMDQLDGTWRYQPNPDFNGTERISYTVSDGLNQTTAELEIVVNPVNDVPEILTPNFMSIQEDETSVVDISVLDADGDLLTFSLTGGEDAGAFELDSTSGALRFSDTPDFESPVDANQDNLYELQVTVSDNNGGQTDHALQVQLDNVNEAPTLTASNIVADSTGNGLRVGQLNAVDPDTGDTLAFEIIGGNSAQFFEMDTHSGELYQAGDEIPTGLYQLDVQVTDAAGLSSTAVIEVLVMKSVDPNTSTLSDLMPQTEETDPNEKPATQAPTQSPFTPISQDLASPEPETDTMVEQAVAMAVSDLQPPTASSFAPDAEVPNFMPVPLSASDGSQQDRPSTHLGQHAGLSVRFILSEVGDAAIAAAGALDHQLANLTLPVSPELADALDALASAAEEEDTQIDLRVSGAVVGTMSLSAGFVAWMLRGGSLMASLLSSKPMWTEFDPLPVFSGEPTDVDSDHPFPK